MPDLCHLHDLTSGYATLYSGRVGSIIHETRKALLIGADGLSANAVPPTDFTGTFAAGVPRINAAARSVGRIVLERDGAKPRVLATCFRAGADSHRIATARHVAAVLLDQGETCPPGYYPPSRPLPFRLRRLFAIFDGWPDAPEERHEIMAIEFLHPDMDLLLARLKTPCTRNALPPALAPVADAGGQADICVIGYPTTMPGPGAEAALFEVAFESQDTGLLRASPGRASGLPPEASANVFVVRHDASTLPGSSGSPVISLADGSLVGLHFGGKGGGTTNQFIYLPSALLEPALRDHFDPALGRPPATDFATGWTDPPTLITGKPLVGDETAEEMFEFAFDRNRRATDSAAPPLLDQSPAVRTDRHDIRDQTYAPPLRDPSSKVDPPDLRMIRRQGCAADCTGCALAATIEIALDKQGRRPETGVSARMLYEMACLHDEFIDDAIGGSSLRGAIKGFYHNGVCQAESDGREATGDWHLSVTRAKAARENALGAYYRLRPSLPEFQMAIQEVGAVVVSAWTHRGWTTPKEGRIERSLHRMDAHAFVLVGYDSEGFLVLNSWGENWGQFGGRAGIAHWSYADWADNVIDAWVLQTAPCAPSAHNLSLRSYRAAPHPAPDRPQRHFANLPEPRRMAIVGHIAHAERGGLVEAGRSGVGQRSLRETALYLRHKDIWAEEKYDGLAFVFHDPILGADAAARLSAHMLPKLKASRVFPINIVYGADEIRSLTVRMLDEANFALGVSGGDVQDLTAYLTRRAAVLCQNMADSFVTGIAEASEPGGPLWRIVASLGFEAVVDPYRKRLHRRAIHIVGIGLGAAVAQGAMANPGTAGFYNLDPGRPFEFDTLTTIAALSCDRLQPRSRSAQRSWAEADAKHLTLSAERNANTIMQGFRGDWCDLLAELLPSGPWLPRANGGTAGASVEAAACAPDVLNAMMRNICQRDELGPWSCF